MAGRHSRKLGHSVPLPVAVVTPMYLPCTHSSLRFQLQAGPASLPTGQTDFNFRIRTNAPGEIELTATVDASGAVAESNEGNNDALSTDVNVIQVMCRIQP